MEALVAILGAALPIAFKILELGGLLVRSHKEQLTVAQVEEEIARIIKRDADQAADIWTATGQPK